MKRQCRFCAGWRLFISKLKGRMSAMVFLMWMGAIAGIAAGFGARVMKWSVGVVSDGVLHVVSLVGWWLVLLVPVTGIILTSFFTRYILRDRIQHGTSLLVRRLRAHIYLFKKREIFGSIIGVSLTLGFGGSAGAEGPIAFTGAAIGSYIGRMCRVSPSTLRVLIGIGAGAGIAGIFKSPIGGVLFTLEVLAMPLATSTVMALIIACVLSAVTCTSLTGFSLDMTFRGLTDGLPYCYYPALMLLGVFAGVYSWYYSRCCDIGGRFFSRIRRGLPRNLVSGLILGGLVVLFPMLYGEGYDAMERLVDGDTGTLTSLSLWHDASPLTFMLVAAGILLCKGFAKSATTDGGGIAGDFAPTLFAGCVAGFLFAYAGNALFGTHLPVGMMSFVGMAAVMAGAVKAPLMAMFIVAEMSGAFKMFVPLAIVSVISYFVVRALEGLSGKRRRIRGVKTAHRFS